MHDQSRIEAAARRWLSRGLSELSPVERQVMERLGRRQALTAGSEAVTGNDADGAATKDDDLGAWMADRVASFGGSWAFIGLFAIGLVLWCGANLLLGPEGFDPYPFIFLNLMLSMLAALQAPVIMMSQNRQAAKDRDAAAHDYAVNLKAELEIILLHEKLDQLRTNQLTQLIDQQQAQLDLLTKALARLEGRG